MSAAQIQNPAGAFGSSITGSDQAAVVRTVKAGAAISAGKVVTLTSTPGSASQVYQATASSAPKLQVGIALQDIASGGVGLVCFYGPVHGVSKATSALTAGDVVQRDATTLGGVVAIGSTTAVTQYKDVNIGIGIVLADATAAGTTASIFVCKN